MKTMKFRAVLAIALLVVLPASFAQAAKTVQTEQEQFLEPDAAFRLSVAARDPTHLAVRFDVAPGYYLYRERIAAMATPPDALAAPVVLPRGQVKFDTTLAKEVETFHDELSISLPVQPGRAFTLRIDNQGCAEKGLCYAPMQRSFHVEPGPQDDWRITPIVDAAAAEGVDVPALDPAPVDVPAPATPADAEEPGHFANALQSRSLWRIGAVFLLAGLALAFTPCVLPMIPILSSIIMGPGQAVSAARGFSLAAAYSLGMALVYTALGMAAGLLGEGLAGALQNAWVHGAFALLLGALALSMFGLYELQVPGAIQSRIGQWSNRLQGGQHVSVFLMGGLSALIVGPCVAAPLAGALVYISQTRDVAIGGVALFALACGMSVPLLLVGVSAGSLLPRAGAWMERVKHLFGVLLLGVALWMVSPVLPAWALMLLLSVALLGLAVWLGAFERLPEGAVFRRHLAKGAGLMLALMSSLELIGAASGGRDPLQPLRFTSPGFAQAAPVASGRLGFETVSGWQGLEKAIRRSAKPVMLDVYADWCVSCKELEALTFADDRVRERLAGLTLVRLDVTGNSAEDKAIMKRYGVFGPPALLFFHPEGRELTDARVVGYQAPDRFLKTLSRVNLPAGTTGSRLFVTAQGAMEDVRHAWVPAAFHRHRAVLVAVRQPRGSSRRRSLHGRAGRHRHARAAGFLGR
jgi:thioredoxin:protein disulfide reductase